MFANNMRGSISVLFLLLALSGTGSVVLNGCSSQAVTESDPAALAKDAEDDIKSDRYQLALEKLKTLKNKFPYSKYAVDAQLRIADVYFMQELYPEAASNYETFRDLHPKHERVAYAMFRIAKSYFNDMPSTVARDLTPAQKCLDAYNDFLRRFPEAPEAVEGHKDLEKARAFLADKELYIADFYLKHNFYESAKPRYQKILDVYPDTPAAAKAQEKLAVCNTRIEKEGPQKGEVTYK
ncbi:MAG: outer membrane protein assembly factor BamD [Oligoflexia bacterium]|nr:outer membrane protein assembly factor BamD [Oligoflexia bacterium]